MSSQDAASESLVALESTLSEVEAHVGAFTKQSVDHVLMDLEPIEKAKAQVALAYTVNALLYVYLKTQGVSAKDIRQTHVKQELDRVKGFVQRIKEAEETAKQRQVTLDKAAANRMVHSALSSDQVYVDALQEKQEQEATAAATESTKNVKTKASPTTKTSKASVQHQLTPSKSKQPMRSTAKATDKKNKRRRKQ